MIDMDRAEPKALRDALTRYVARRVPREDVEDLVQDIFLRVYERREQLEDQARVSPWLFRVARSVVVDYHRKRARRPATMTMAAAPTDAPEAITEPDTTEEPDLAPIVASWLRGMTANLPEPYREVLELTELGGMSQRQAASHLGLSPSGARTRVQRARVALREDLLRCCQVALDARNHVVDVTPNKPECC